MLFQCTHNIFEKKSGSDYLDFGGKGAIHVE